MNEWIILRCRVSLGGRVLGEDAEAVRGGEVRVSATSNDGETIVAGVRRDGRYVFEDLRPGDYVVGGVDERGRALVARDVTVPLVDRTRRPPLAAFDLRVAPPAAVPGG